MYCERGRGSGEGGERSGEPADGWRRQELRSGVRPREEERQMKDQHRTWTV